MKGAGRGSACGQTLNKPPGTKQRDVVARADRGAAYGDLTSFVVLETGDDWSIGPSATHSSTPTAVIGVTSACARGKEIDRYGTKRQQGALGTGNLDADTAAWGWNCKVSIMAAHESAADAS